MKQLYVISSVLCVCLLGVGPTSAATLRVSAGGSLQTALNAAKPGDIILLQAGATFTGNYILPAKSGTSYIIVRSSASDTQLPPAGVRITTTYASLLPKIKACGNRLAGDQNGCRRASLEISVRRDRRQFEREHGHREDWQRRRYEHHHAAAPHHL